MVPPGMSLAPTPGMKEHGPPSRWPPLSEVRIMARANEMEGGRVGSRTNTVNVMNIMVIVAQIGQLHKRKASPCRARARLKLDSVICA